MLNLSVKDKKRNTLSDKYALIRDVNTRKIFELAFFW